MRFLIWPLVPDKALIMDCRNFSDIQNRGEKAVGERQVEAPQMSVPKNSKSCAISVGC